MFCRLGEGDEVVAEDGLGHFNDLVVAAGEFSEGLVTDVATESKEGGRCGARLEDIPCWTIGGCTICGWLYTLTAST